MTVSQFVRDAGGQADGTLPGGSTAAALTTVLVCVAALLLIVAVVVRRRNRHLVWEAANARTFLFGEDRPLAQVLWEHQQVGALGGPQQVLLLNARSPVDVERALVAVGGTTQQQQELAIAIARAEQVQESAAFVTRGVNASVPAVDAVLSQVGGLGAILPGAALGVVQAQDALDLLGIDLDLVRVGLDVGAGAVEGYADNLLSGHMPLLTMVMVARKEMQLVSSGKSVSKALQHGTLDVAAKAGGAFVGLKAGLLAGSLIAPGIGSAIGALVGAFAGGMAGTSAAFSVKARPLVEANEELAGAALAAIPADTEAVWNHLVDVAFAPYTLTYGNAAAWCTLTRPGSLAWWPTFGEALHDQSLRYMNSNLKSMEALQEGAVGSVSTACASHFGAAGAALVVLNCPIEAAALGVTPQAVQALIPLQKRAAALRAELVTAS